MNNELLKVNIIFKDLKFFSASKVGSGDKSLCLILYNALKKRKDIEVYFNEDCASNNFDIIHIHSVNSKVFSIIKNANTSNIVITAHIIPETIEGSSWFDKIWKPFFTIHLKRIYNQAKLVIAVSPYTKQKLEELHLKPKIVYIPNGIDRDIFKPDPKVRSYMREKYKLDDKDIVILSVGQTIKRKGFDSFVKVAKSLPQYKFFWIGGIPFSFLSSGYSEVKRVQASPPPNLFLPGPQPHEEIYKFYNMADIFFF
ncbi:MAG: glycosyl transferase family 1, partial [Dictyoglomus sp. NZ13-RE01]